MIENEEPVQDTENQVTPEEVTEETPKEFDIETTDNLKELRDYAKSLKADLPTYKASHTFIEEKFGGTSNAELAANLLGGFAGDDFDPNKFLETISQLSPTRAKQLTDMLSSKEAAQLAQIEIEKMFGGKVAPDEVKLFQDWKKSGYGLGEGDDIPEALKFNSDGTPKSDEEVEFLRNVQKTIKENSNRDKEAATIKEQDELNIKQTKVNNDINEFSTDRLKILSPELDALGLKHLDTDSAEQRQEKDFLRNLLVDGIAGAFMKNVEYSKDYQSAMEHIQNGEVLLARRYEPRIEKNLLEIVRSKSVVQLLKSLNKTETPQEEIPEINNSGTPTNSSTPTGKRVTANDITEKLIAEGKLTV